MKNILFILFVTVFVLKHKFYAQNKTMDSLNLALKSAKHDTIRLNIYEKLTELCEVEDNLKYANPGLIISKKLLAKRLSKNERTKILKQKANFIIAIIDYHREHAIDYNKVINYTIELFPIYEELKDTLSREEKYVNMMALFFKVGNSSRAMDSALSRLKYYEKIKSKKWTAFYHKQLGLIYTETGDFNKSNEYFEKSLNYFKTTNDDEQTISIYQNISENYIGIGDLKKPLDTYFKALKLVEKGNDQRKIFNILYGISSCYKELNDTTNAFANITKCLYIAQKQNNPISIGAALRIKAQIYYKLKKYKKSLELGLKSLEYFKIANYKEAIFGGLRTVTKIYLTEKKYDLAIKYGLEAEQVAIEDKNIYSISNISLLLYDIYQEKGDYKKALHYHLNHIHMRDSITKKQTQTDFNEKTLRYEFEKSEMEAKSIQEKKDAINNEEKQQQRIILYSVSIGLFLVLLLVLFVFRGLKQKQKDNAIITQQKIEVENAKHIVEEKHKEITDSINYAERIQKTFLASNDLLNQHLHNYFILFKPKDVVSGDFYWADTLPNGNFILATADSTGHGVPGAIMSLLNITSLEKAVEHLTNPAEILNHTRQTIIKRLKKDGSAEGGKDGMDCSVIVFDFKNKQLHIAAAHNPVWIIRKRHCEGDSLKKSQTIDEIASLPRNDESLELIEIKPDKMPVGKHDRDQETFTAHTLDIKEGDIIYTLTDGFPDQFGGDKGKKFMSKNLKDLLLANAHLPMNEQKKMLHQTFNKWVGNLEQVDDVTLIGIKL
jgi:serine phosphatase RsbU (regulator of sigma subunit)